MVSAILWLKSFLEYLGGVNDDAPPGLPLHLGSALWGVWWGILLLIVLVFCGQSSSFIYIDF